MLVDKVKTYSRLLKLNVPELSLYPLTSFGLASAHIGESRYWLIMLSFLLFSLCCGTLTIALDDIMGYIDGVDQLSVLETKRNLAKPLLTGELSVAEARVVALGLAGLATTLILFWVWVAKIPAGTVALLLCAAGVVTQYSFGLKLSYRYLGEAVIIYGAAMATALPYLILVGTVTPVVLWTAVMNGIPYAAQIVISNAIDIKSDAAAGRRTLTVMVGERRAPLIAAAFLSLFWILFTVAMMRGELPRAALLSLLLLPNHVRFLRLSFAGQNAAARLLSFQTIRLQLALITVAHLLANHMAALS